MALFGFSGLLKDVPYDGGVDERRGVYPVPPDSQLHSLG
jgi:hypothetical protein